MERFVFKLNGEVVEVDRSKLHLNAAEFIRQHALCKSVKVGCSEGGCGACAVEVIQTDAATGQQSVLALNSCLMPVAALHGCHIITSEGLGNSRQGFHEVHKRLAGFHGTQCGFCSPGMSISCHAALMAAANRATAAAAAAAGDEAAAAAAAGDEAAAAVGGAAAANGAAGEPYVSDCYENGSGQHACSGQCNGGSNDSGAECVRKQQQDSLACQGTGSCSSSSSAVGGPTAAELLSALDGNLCRCTGWRPIADCVKSFACDVDIEDLGLNTLNPQQLGPITTHHQQQLLLPAALQQPQPAVKLDTPEQQRARFYAALQTIQPGDVLVPHSLQQLLAALKAAQAAAVPVHLMAGNTGAGIYKHQWQAAAAAAAVLVKHVPELQQITFDHVSSSAGQTLVNGRSTGDSSSTSSSSTQAASAGPTLTAGAGVTISRLLQALKDLSAAESAQGHAQGAQNLQFLTRHIGRIAGTLVRNAATLGGHLALVRSEGLESDLMPMLMAAGAEVQITDLEGETTWLGIKLFLSPSAGPASCSNGSACTASSAAAAALLQQLSCGAALITAVRLPLPVDQPGSISSSTAVFSYKLTTHRHCNEHAAANICCWLSSAAPLAAVNSSSGSSSSGGYQLRIAVGTYQPNSSSSSSDSDSGSSAGEGESNAAAGVVWRCSRARHVEAAVTAALQQQQRQQGDGSGGQVLLDVLASLPQLLAQDIQPAGRMGEYVRSAAPGLLLKGLAVVLPHELKGPAVLPHEQQQQQQQQPVSPPAASAPNALPVSSSLLLELRAAATAALADAAAVPRGKQDLPVNMEADPPLYWPTAKDGSHLQASGEAEYADDVPLAAGALYAAYVTSTRAYAALLDVDWSPAMEVEGVVGFVGPDDIPAGPAAVLNNRTAAGPPEPLFAWQQVEYVGQPLGLIVAKTLSAARAGAARVQVTYGPVGGNPTATGGGEMESGTLPSDAANGSSSCSSKGALESAGGGADVALTSLAAAIAANSWYDLSKMPGMSAQKGDVAAALSSCARVLSGQLLLGSQRHFYMEPQTAVASPEEGGRLAVVSSCQGVDQVLWAVSKLLCLRHNQVHASCRRVGGGFGGKADRAIFPAAAAAVAAHKLRRQVRLVVSTAADGCMNAGRCPMRVDWTAGLDGAGSLAALQLDVTCTAGAFLGATVVEVGSICTASDSVYTIPAFGVSVKVARCHLPPRTSVRGPGKVSAIIMLEHIMQQLATTLGHNPDSFRESLMIKLPDEALAAAAAAEKAAAGDADASSAAVDGCIDAAATGQLHCGGQQGLIPHPKYLPQALESGAALSTMFGKPIALQQYTLPYMWQAVQAASGYQARRAAVEAFNRQHRLKKRGLALVPTRYQVYHRQCVSTVTIYADGSVLLMHPGTEMGQGIATKAIQAAAHTLGQLLPPGQRGSLLQYMRVAGGSSELMPHASVAAASTTSEAATAAVTLACEMLLERLRPAAEQLAAAGRAAGGAANGTASTGSAAAGGTNGAGSAGSAAGAAGAGAAVVSPVVSWEAVVKAVAPPDPVMASKVVLTATARGGLIDDGPFTPGSTYHTFGVGVAEVQLDCLTGERQLLAAHLMFDAGRSVNPAVDLGQVEGAFMQGVGHVMSEEVVEDEATGATLTHNTWTYKPPGMAELPRELRVDMLHDSPLHIPKLKQLSAKATGEPPFMLAAAVVCALQDAIAAAWADHNSQQQQQKQLKFISSRQAGAGLSKLSQQDGVAAKAECDAAWHKQQPVLQLPATTANVKRALPPVLI